MTTPANSIAATNPGTTWLLDPERSTLTFRNKTFWGALTVKGTFSDVDGEGEITSSHTVAGVLRVGAASLSTGIGKRDEHLRSADFFDVANHPEITVEVHGAKVTGADQLDLDATLTIKESAHRLVLPATAELLDDGAVRITSHTKINREELGVDGNLLGMIPPTTLIEGVAVFTPRAGAAS
ncbi:MAG: YceI family protein [Mycobacterium sp.]